MRRIILGTLLLLLPLVCFAQDKQSYKSTTDYILKTQRLWGISEVRVNEDQTVTLVDAKTSGDGYMLFLFDSNSKKDFVEQVTLSPSESCKLSEHHHVSLTYRLVKIEKDRITFEITDKFDARAFGKGVKSETKQVSIIPYSLETAEASANDNQTQPLQLAIKSDKEVYEVGEKINLTFIFRNNSIKDISFCRFLLKYNLLKRNIKLKNQRGDIYEVFDKVQLEMPNITKEDFVILHPNDEYALELQLNTIFPQDSTLVYLNQGMMRELPIGTYQIASSYNNNIDYLYNMNEIEKGIPKKIPINNVWTGTLISNAITIKVTEKKGVSKDISSQRSSKIIKRSVGQGDYVRDEREPAEACNLLIQEVRDSNPGMDCKLINSGRVDSPENFAECADGATVAGCFTCIFECK